MNILDEKFYQIVMMHAQALNEGKIFPKDFVSMILQFIKIQENTESIDQDSGRVSNLSMSPSDVELFIADEKKTWGENEAQAKRFIQESHNLLEVPSSARPINVLAVEDLGPIVGQDTLLGIAADAGNKAAVDLILDNGADPSWTSSNYKKTLLIYLAQNGGDPEIGQKIIKHRARYDGDKANRINAVDYNGWTAFLYACHRGHMGMVEMLLDFPMLDVSHSARRGLTALHAAALNDNSNLCHILLQRGAEPSKVADIGFGRETPLQIAQRKEFLETMEVFQHWH